MNFVLTGDKNYVLPLTVLMTSILVNISKKFTPRFFLFTTDFGQADLNKMEQIKKIRPCEIVNMPMEQYLHYFDQQDASTFRLQYISLATYYRLLMFKILPDDVDKCFYVDGDMIVDKDLAPIYKNLPKNKLAAVVVEILAMTNKDTTLAHLADMSDFKPFQKDPYAAPYFNAGFFLANIKRAKELNIFEQCLDFLKRYPNPAYADQDTLNAVLGQKYYRDLILLDPSYNVFCDIPYEDWYDSSIYTRKQIKKAFTHPIICHYAGANKPWQTQNVMNHYKIWWRYCRLSPFKKVPELKSNEATLNRKYKLFDLILILRQKKIEGRDRFYLFGLLPIWTIKYKGTSTANHYLFNIIPILKIKKKG